MWLNQFKNGNIGISTAFTAGQLDGQAKEASVFVSCQNFLNHLSKKQIQYT